MDRETLIAKYPDEVRILRERGRLVDDWANVFEHCVTEARVAAVLADRLKLPVGHAHELVVAAFLHDWNKRNEREAANREGFEAYNRQAVEGAVGLITLGYSARIVELIEAVGHTALTKISGMDFVQRVMHYIDNITYGDKVAGVDERMDALEAAPRYKELNESGRAVHGGRTYFEIQREVAKSIEKEIEVKIGEPVIPLLRRALGIS